jgi:hypothetical protein
MIRSPSPLRHAGVGAFIACRAAIDYAQRLETCPLVADCVAGAIKTGWANDQGNLSPASYLVSVKLGYS